MRIPGPYSDDTWDWMSRSQDFEGTDARTQATNGLPRVLWELGLVLFVPLAGTGVIELVLRALRIS